MTADTALSLDGTGRLDFSLKQGPKRDVLLKQLLQGVTSDPVSPSSLEVRFRTRSKTGTLLHVQESSNYTTVKVRGSPSCPPQGNRPLIHTTANPSGSDGGCVDLRSCRFSAR